MFNTLCFKIWLCFISVWFSLPIKLISTNCYSLLKRQCWVLGNMTQYSASYVSMKTWVWFTQEPSVEAQLWLQPWGKGVIGWTQVAPWSQPASVWPSGAVTDSCLKNKVEKDTWSWALVSISRYGLHKGREVEREAKRWGTKRNMAFAKISLTWQLFSYKLNVIDKMAQHWLLRLMDLISTPGTQTANCCLTCTLVVPSANAHICNKPLKAYHRSIRKKINVQGCLQWQSLAKTLFRARITYPC